MSVQGNFTHITKIWHSKNTPYTTDARLAGKQAAASHPANAALPRLAKIGKTCGVISKYLARLGSTPMPTIFCKSLNMTNFWTNGSMLLIFLYYFLEVFFLRNFMGLTLFLSFSMANVCILENNFIKNEQRNPVQASPPTKH